MNLSVITKAKIGRPSLMRERRRDALNWLVRHGEPATGIEIANGIEIPESSIYSVMDHDEFCKNGKMFWVKGVPTKQKPIPDGSPWWVYFEAGL